ncbi:MAG: DUF1003 domain-containing protein [Candidatus Dojkabacteria bacterium]
MEIPKLEDLKKLREPIINTHHKVHLELSPLDKAALFITKHVGTMGFFIIIFIWTSTWLAWNTLGPKELRFDPFPAFAFWLFISNMIQIFLMPIIMIGQNLQGRHYEATAEGDYVVNKRAEREIEVVLMHLESQEKKLDEILSRLK